MSVTPPASNASVPNTAPSFTTEHVLGIFLILLTVCAYIPALAGGFVWDDFQILQLANVKEPAGVLRTWLQPLSVTGEEHYWPMVYTVFWTLYQLVGSDPFLYHAVNVALHIANCFLLKRIMTQLAMPGGWAAAFVFALHPVHVESVAWIIELKDVLSGLFILLAVSAFLPLLNALSWRRTSMVFALALLGLFSKSVAAVLPAILLILTYYQLGRVPGRVAALLGGISAMVVGVMIFDFTLMRTVGNVIEAPDFLHRVQIAGASFWFYAKQLVFPYPLAPMYPKFSANPEQLLAWMPFALAAATTVTFAVVAILRTQWRAPFAAYLLYGVALAPTLGFIAFTFMKYSYVADRYQYLASAAPIAAVCAFVAARVSYDKFKQRLAIGAAALVCAVYLPLTYAHSASYASPELHARSILALQPQHPLAYQLLTTALNDQKRFAEALAAAREYARLSPDETIAWYNLGLLLARENQLVEARECLRRALRLNPQHHNAQRLLQRVEADLAKMPQ